VAGGPRTTEAQTTEHAALCGGIHPFCDHGPDDVPSNLLERNGDIVTRLLVRRPLELEVDVESARGVGR